MFRVNIKTELCSSHFNPWHPFKAISGQLIYVSCILILLVYKSFPNVRVPTGFELFRNFSKTNESQENFIRHLLANIAKIARITNITKL